MASVPKIEAQMRESVANVQYADLLKVCRWYFGEPRQGATSHAFFKTPWTGKPYVNLQSDHGKAKSYQVRQVLEAIDYLHHTTREEGF